MRKMTIKQEEKGAKEEQIVGKINYFVFSGYGS